MKKIEAIIRHLKLDDVKDPLRALGLRGMTLTEVHGYGRQGGHKETYRGAEYTIDYLPKLKVEVVVDNRDAETVVDPIQRVARTVQVGDGQIYVSELSQVQHYVEADKVVSQAFACWNDQGAALRMHVNDVNAKGIAAMTEGKFVGCLLGLAVGDVLGGHFAGQTRPLDRAMFIHSSATEH